VSRHILLYHEVDLRKGNLMRLLICLVAVLLIVLFVSSASAGCPGSACRAIVVTPLPQPIPPVVVAPVLIPPPAVAVSVRPAVRVAVAPVRFVGRRLVFKTRRW
jgi:hypothetical protein